jgi:hypothetical protein
MIRFQNDLSKVVKAVGRTDAATCAFPGGLEATTPAALLRSTGEPPPPPSKPIERPTKRMSSTHLRKLQGPGGE